MMSNLRVSIIGRLCIPVVAMVLLAGVMRSLGEEVSFRTLAQGGSSGITQATNRVIKTQGDWEKLWQRHQGNVDPAAKVPVVDFDKEMVLAAALGQKRTGGFAIKIVRVESTATGLKVFLAQRTPGPGSLVIQALTAPFHFVAVPKKDGKAEFVISAN